MKRLYIFFIKEMIFGTVILAIWSRVAMMADGYIWNVAGLMGPYNIRVIFCCYKE